MTAQRKPTSSRATATREALRRAEVTDEEWRFLVEVVEVLRLAKDALKDLSLEVSQSPKALMTKLEVIENALNEVHDPVVEIATRVAALRPPSGAGETKPADSL